MLHQETGKKQRGAEGRDTDKADLNLITLYYNIWDRGKEKKKIKEACQFLTSCIFIAISIFLAGREGVIITLIWISA